MGKKVTVVSPARVVCASCLLADTPWTRLRGLMGRKELVQDEGLLLRPSGSVHTCFMRFPIDVVFLDRNLEVIAVEPAVRPWRLRACRGARAVLELPAGEASRAGIRTGDPLTLDSPATAEATKEEAHARC